MSPRDAGAELDARFAATVAEERGRPGTLALTADFPPLRVPGPLRASCVEAARFEDGKCPEPLLNHYGVTMPRERIDQLHRAGDLRESLHERLDLERMPRLRTALEGIFRAL